MIVMNSLLSISIFFSLFTISSYASQPSYKDHCSSILQESTPINLIQNSSPFGDRQTGYFKGGSRIIQVSTSSNKYSIFSLRLNYMHTTQDHDLFKVEANVSFRSIPSTVYYHRGNFTFGGKSTRYVGQRQYRRSYVTFKLDGFWSKSLGKVCMVGKGSGYSKTGDSVNLDSVFKLTNVFNENNITSLVSGSLESLSSEKDDNYFDTISVFIFPKANYDYTLDSKVENEFSSGSEITEKGLSINLDSLSFCSYQLSSMIRRLQLEYSSECSSSKNCTPIGGNSDQLPFLMSLKGIECSLTHKHFLRVMMTFPNMSDYWIDKSFDPKTVLVGEGWWNEKKNELCVVACHIISTHVGDCSVRLRLKFPSIWSIKNTKSIVGQIWSNKSANDPDYFKMITFRNFEDHSTRAAFQASKYEYSQLERVKQSCPAHKVVKNKGKRYPDVYSYNMRFDMSVTSSNRRVGWGYSYPLFVEDQVYGPDLYEAVPVTLSMNSTAEIPMVMLNNDSLFNISYKIALVSNSTLYEKNSLFNLSSSTVKISAEGTYDAGTGNLCMVGCRDLPSKTRTPIAASLDCEILLKFQFPSLDSKGGSYIKGVVESSRKESDPLYFKSLELSSAAFYTETARKAVWRMDMEIIMVLISTTLAVVFLGLQLYHVKRYPDVLPFISLIMMSILTLGYMIPLVLNFEALLAPNPNNKNFVFGNVGWLEVNEIVVRLITMLAFLLQFRLLQLTWSSRKTNEGEKGLWAAERRAAYVTLPLYAAGLMIALLLKLKKDGDSATTVYRNHHSSWENIKSYGGLVLDGFLLPQIILNLFSNMRENVLSCSFYFGTTFVRLLPHAYDLYRTRNYARLGDGSYYYADPSADFYSTAWDIVIPLGGILLAICIYFQQRFGSQYILPHRFRGLEVYEKVPMVTELETEVENSNL